MNPSLIVSRLRKTLVAGGAWQTLRRLGLWAYRRAFPRRLPAHPFDLQHGVDTGGLIDSLGLASGHAHDRYITAYWGTSPFLFRAVLRQWSASLAATGNRVEEYTFVDLGSGKGRVVLLASDKPFRRILGVEISPAMAAVATRNLGIWRQRPHACEEITLLNADALDVPLDDTPTLLYLYHPFDEPLMQRLLDRLQALSYMRCSPIDFIYTNPVHGELFDRIPSMELIWDGYIPYAPEESAVDAFDAQLDHCRIYRLPGNAAHVHPLSVPMGMGGRDVHQGAMVQE